MVKFEIKQIIKSISRQDAEQQNIQKLNIRTVGKQDQSQKSPGHTMVGYYINQRDLHTEAGIDTGKNSFNVKMK